MKYVTKFTHDKILDSIILSLHERITDVVKENLETNASPQNITLNLYQVHMIIVAKILTTCVEVINQTWEESVNQND